jgi:large subunit ribosomal protein L5
MNRLRSHYKYVVQYDLITKLSHINCITLPKIESVTLNFGIKESVISTKKILAPLLALELVTGQKGVVTKSKKDLIRYKIRKGMIVGCKVNLRNKENLFSFLEKLVSMTLPRIRYFNGIRKGQVTQKGNLNLRIVDLLAFHELEQEYEKFKDLPPLDISIVTTAKTQKEAIVLLSSFQIPFIK